MWPVAEPQRSLFAHQAFAIELVEIGFRLRTSESELLIEIQAPNPIVATAMCSDGVANHIAF